MPPLVEAEGLVKTYQGGRVRALDGLDFAAAEGDMVAITGPSGGGKSTLLYALSGLIALDAGLVRIGGRRPATAAEWVALRARAIGMVFQEDWLLPGLTAAENVELPMLGVETSAAARRARVATLLEEVGAAALAARHPAGLSGGERQRVAIARSLANRPRLLLADEPTGELDSASAAAILALLARLHHEDGLTLLIVSHDERVAAACRRRFLVADGRGRYADA